MKQRPKETLKVVQNNTKTELTEEQKSMIDQEIKSVVEKAREYNESINEVPEHYKTFVPQRGLTLVKLSLNDNLRMLATGNIDKNTGKPETETGCYFAQGEAMDGYGIIISGDNAGKNVLVTPESFFAQIPQVGFIMSPQFKFETPKHKEFGYFLIPDRFIKGTWD